MKEQKKTTYHIHTNTGGSLIQEDHFEIKTNDFTERKIDVQNSFATIKYKEILLNNAVVVIRSDNITPPLHMDVRYDYPFIKLHFELEGDSNYIPNDSNSLEVSINKCEYNLFYLPKVNGTLSYFEPNRKSLEIMISEEFLINTFHSGFDKISSSFGKALKNKKAFKLFEVSQSIPSALMFVVNDILNCSYQKEIKEIYLESKIKEIFSYLFANLNKKKPTQYAHKLTEEERKQVFLAKKLLLDYLDKTLTIKTLANMAGTNDYKLKRNFKLLTGKPIIAYLNDMRMEKARTMLIDENINIADVAYAIGYKNPQHFTTAFKKKFNYLPSDIKKKLQCA